MAQSKRKSKKMYSKQSHKVMSSKNSKSLRHTLTKKANFNIKKLETQLKSQIKVREYALQSENLEMYAHANKIIMIMLLQLLAQGSAKAIQLANEYSEKTGIELNEDSLKRQLNKLPTVKSTVKKAKNSYHNPPSTSMAAAWKWN